VECQSGTTQRLAHHKICSIGLEANNSLLGEVSPNLLLRSPPARSCDVTDSRLRKRWSQWITHETTMFSINKQSVFWMCDIVTAGCCLFVSPSSTSGGVRRESNGSGRHLQPHACRCHGATRPRARRQSPERAKWKKLSTGLLLHRPIICQLRATVALTCE
jgi:hypothetical protein